MKINDSGVPAALPHAVMGIIVVVGGQFADYLRASGRMSTTTVRKVFNCGGIENELEISHECFRFRRGGLLHAFRRLYSK